MTQLLSKLPEVPSKSTFGGKPVEPARRTLLQPVKRAAPPRRRSRPIFAALCLILLPAVAAAFFATRIATPLYMSEIRFSIRSGDQTTPGTTGSASAVSGLLTGAPSALGVIDGYAVRDFIDSRDALRELERRVGFRAKVANIGIDPLLTGFNPLLWFRELSDEERLFRIYRAVVRPRFHMLEQIVVVDVYGLTTTDAKAIAEGLLVVSEQFAERMNQRAREDWLKISQAEVDRAEKRALDARLALTNWRKANNNIDPGANVQLINQLIGQLEGSLAQTRAELAAVLALGDQQHPRRRPIEQRIEAIQAQIKSARDRLTGVAKSEAVYLGEYQRLVLMQEFADKALEANRQSAEAARLNLARQMKYVVPVVQPTTPGVIAYPNPYSMVGGGLAAGFVLCLLVSLIWGAARDLLRR